jgi:hypothetical protein
MLDLILSFPPYPEVAREIFGIAKIVGGILGILFAILLYQKSRTRGFGNLFLGRRFLGNLAAFVAAFVVYIFLYQTDLAVPLRLWLAALLYLYLNAVLALIVVLIVLMAPSRLVKMIKGWFAS